MIDKRLLVGIIIIAIGIVIYYIDMLTYGKRNKVSVIPHHMIRKITFEPKGHLFSQPKKGISSTLSFWIYVKDWHYKFMEYKQIFKKGSLEIYMPPKNNYLIMDIPVIGKKNKETIIFKNVPLQKWLNVVIIIDKRHVDLWINGKMYQSKYLSNIANLENDKKIICGDNKGFDGYLSRVTSWKYVLSKSKIVNTFKAGPIDNSLLQKIKNLGAKINIVPKIKFNVQIDADIDADIKSD
tara:strand:- start:3996 stop:4709 length:714 start_codon:yes stop_codon:yes gene_type:complete